MAGDPERSHMRKVKDVGGIHYHVNLLEAMVGQYGQLRCTNIASDGILVLIF